MIINYLMAFSGKTIKFARLISKVSETNRNKNNK